MLALTLPHTLIPQPCALLLTGKSISRSQSYEPGLFLACSGSEPSDLLRRLFDTGKLIDQYQPCRGDFYGFFSHRILHRISLHLRARNCPIGSG